MTKDMPQPHPPLVHIVSHGPYCLDGVAAAVAVARYRAGTTIVPHFSGNERINEVLRSISPDAAPSGSELWITDISWTEKETDAHLRSLAAQGTKIYWFDHHRTALKRHAAGEVDVPFADHVVSEEKAAARLVYEYLEKQSTASGQSSDTLAAAICDGHPSEIGDAWGKNAAQTIFAFYDLKGEGISLRRSPDCKVDLSQLAQLFGGGGHPAAAGCRPAALYRLFAQQVAQLLLSAFSALAASDATKDS